MANANNGDMEMTKDADHFTGSWKNGYIWHHGDTGNGHFLDHIPLDNIVAIVKQEYAN